MKGKAFVKIQNEPKLTPFRCINIRNGNDRFLIWNLWRILANLRTLFAKLKFKASMVTERMGRFHTLGTFKRLRSGFLHWVSIIKGHRFGRHWICVMAIPFTVEYMYKVGFLYNLFTWFFPINKFPSKMQTSQWFNLLKFYYISGPY